MSPPPTPSDPPRHEHVGRFQVLDGWRAISILLVLACHMLPLGPKAWQLNGAAGPMGMSLFFTLSGFLITYNLHRNSSVPVFLIRRLTRIVPLAYLAAVFYLLIQQALPQAYVSHLLFFINYRTEDITLLTSPFWSLCVEIHFYMLAALVVGLLGRRGLLALPLLSLAVTALRVNSGVPISIVTHLRVDEILAGACLALVYLDLLGNLGYGIRRMLSTIPLVLLLVGFAIACHPASGGFQYARPYMGAMVVGQTVFVTGWFHPLLASRPMRYVAEISYALYVVHPLMRYGWLDSGTKLVRYMKRPLCIALTFGLAHLSTFHYERHWIAIGKKWGQRWQKQPTMPVIRAVNPAVEPSAGV